MLLVLQLGFSLSICRLASAAFVCEDDLSKGSCRTTETCSFPEHLHACQQVFLSLYCIQQGVHSELMGTRFCFRDGDCSGVLQRGMVSFPCFAALETNPDFGCMLGHVLLVRKIPVCWQHLEFWETVLLVICIVEHAPHVGWLFDCFDGFMFET